MIGLCHCFYVDSHRNELKPFTFTLIDEYGNDKKQVNKHVVWVIFRLVGGVL